MLPLCGFSHDQKILECTSSFYGVQRIHLAVFRRQVQWIFHANVGNYSGLNFQSPVQNCRGDMHLDGRDGRRVCWVQSSIITFCHMLSGLTNILCAINSTTNATKGAPYYSPSPALSHESIFHFLVPFPPTFFYLSMLFILSPTRIACSDITLVSEVEMIPEGHDSIYISIWFSRDNISMMYHLG